MSCNGRTISVRYKLCPITLLYKLAFRFISSPSTRLSEDSFSNSSKQIARPLNQSSDKIHAVVHYFHLVLLSVTWFIWRAQPEDQEILTNWRDLQGQQSFNGSCLINHLKNQRSYLERSCTWHSRNEKVHKMERSTYKHGYPVRWLFTQPEHDCVQPWCRHSTQNPVDDIEGSQISPYGKMLQNREGTAGIKQKYSC